MMVDLLEQKEVFESPCLYEKRNRSNLKQTTPSFAILPAIFTILLIGCSLIYVLGSIYPNSLRNPNPNVKPNPGTNQGSSPSHPSTTEHFWMNDPLLYSKPISSFDHPEPNYVILPGVAEFWSCLTTIPMAGSLLMYSAIYFDYPAPLVYLYFHIIVMYCLACISHMTLIPPIFEVTVSAVVLNGLVSFTLWGQLVSPLFIKYPLIQKLLALLGAVVSISTIHYLPFYFNERGGFQMLAVVQPPFVFIALCATFYLYLNNQTFNQCKGFKLLLKGSTLLMTAMIVSIIETWVIVDGMIINEWGSFPSLHVLIHLLEQTGIFLYGVGAAYLHLVHMNKRNDVQIKYFFIFPIVTTGNVPEEKENKNNLMAVDLLNENYRKDPHTFYNFLLNSDNELPPILPALGEPNTFCVFAVHLMKNILSDDVNFSSHPYSDERGLGLSTMSKVKHDAHLRLVAAAFSKSTLIQNKDIYSNISSTLTNMCLDEAMNSQDKTFDLVKWSYRVVMASGLATLGAPSSVYFNLDTLDQLSRYSIDMVKLAAPVGGTGSRNGISFLNFFHFFVNLMKSIPDTLSLIWNTGLFESWSMLRPDLNIFQEFWFSASGGGKTKPRNGVFYFSDSLSTVPRYLNFVNKLWIQVISESNLDQADEQFARQSAFHSLWAGRNNKIISTGDALTLIVQCLVSMTTANAIVNGIDDLLKRPTLFTEFQFDSTGSALNNFINDELRLNPPLQRLPRRVCNPNGTKINGEYFPFDTQLLLMIGSQALEDLKKGDSNDNVFASGFNGINNSVGLTFGLGMHRCLGNELVKIEMREAIKAFIQTLHAPQLYAKVQPGPKIYNIDVGNYGFHYYNLSLQNNRSDIDDSKTSTEGLYRRY